MMKMSMKKRILMMAMVAMSTVFAFGQSKGDVAIGGNLLYGAKSNYTNFGIGAKMQWSVTDNIRIEPGANYFFKKDYVSMYDVNINAHYLFPVADRFKLYPLAGIVFVGVKLDGFDTDTNMGFNLGGGAEYALTERLSMNFEAKYQLVDNWNRPVFSIGLAYRL